MRKVIGVLNEYDTILTDHFVIRVATKDQLLGQYMSEYLEEVHKELSAQYGYEPEARTQFEIYSDAKGQTAHAWFSARMVGLPWIQTIGASTGQIVALASPNDVGQPFNWARVLKHEYVHILTLQQTQFNIPHWYTEALAVRSEGMVMPDEWKDLLVERVPAGTAFTLKNLNDGFQRPKGPGDWSMAYCQSRLYAQYLEDNYGEKVLAELLECYRLNQPTEAAIPEVTKVSLKEFEAGYLDFLEKIVVEIEASDATPIIDVVKARAAYETDKTDLPNAGRYVYALFTNGGDKDEAKTLAVDINRTSDTEPWAAATLARACLDEKDEISARIFLETARDDAKPNPVTLSLLAEIYIEAEEYELAAELYAIGVEKFPRESEFLEGQALALLKLDLPGEEGRQQLITALKALSDADTENLGARRKLAQLALEAEEFKEASYWAREMIYVDVENVEAHVLLGRVAEAMQEMAIARKEFENARTLDAYSVDARLGLARLDIAAKDDLSARKHLESVLRDEAGQAEAKALLKQIGDEPGQE